MRLDENIRRLGFEAYEILTGSQAKCHIKDLTTYFKDPLSGKVNTEERLNSLLDHAVKTVPFYEQYRGYRSLKEFPVIEKKTIKQHYDQFISFAFINSNLKIATTSGSYGTPMKYMMTKEKYQRRFAEIVFFNRWAGYEVGMKHVLTRIIPKGKLKLFLENEFVIYPANIDENWLAEKSDFLDTHKPSFLISYPSILLALAKYILENRSEYKNNYLKGIVSISEPLLEEDRDVIESAFGCPVLGRYSCEEFGVLAHECAAERKYHMNTASYHFEVLAIDDDIPAKISEPGRLVVTDLFSHAMPLIRYDTGDITVLGHNCQCGLKTTVLERIEGRLAEIIYNTAARMVSPLALVTPIARTLEGILQFQFLQEGMKEYVLKIIPMSSYPFEQSELIRGKLLKLLGSEAVIDIEYVDSIPPLPSGKRPYIINNYMRC